MSLLPEILFLWGTEWRNQRVQFSKQDFKKCIETQTFSVSESGDKMRPSVDVMSSQVSSTIFIFHGIFEDSLESFFGSQHILYGSGRS